MSENPAIRRDISPQRRFSAAKVQQKNDIRKFVCHFFVDFCQNRRISGYLLIAYIMPFPSPSSSIFAWSYWVYLEIT